MPAITVSRKLGSLGTQIAHALAEELGYRMVWREVINKAACAACCPEMALAIIDDLDLFGLRPPKTAHRAYLEAVQSVIKELAIEGDTVIVGRAAQIVLRESPDVLHVRVIAPLDLRIERVAAGDGIALVAARARVERSDRTRRSYLRRHYHVDWDSPELYDLVINTAYTSAPAATELVALAWRQRFPLEPPLAPPNQHTIP